MLDWLGKMLQLPESFLTENGGEGGGVIQVRRAGCPAPGTRVHWESSHGGWGGRRSGGVLVRPLETAKLTLGTLGLGLGPGATSPTLSRPCSQGDCHAAGATAQPRWPWAAKAPTTPHVCRSLSCPAEAAFSVGGVNPSLHSTCTTDRLWVRTSIRGHGARGTVMVGRVVCPSGVCRAKAAEQTGTRCGFISKQEGGLYRTSSLSDITSLESGGW